MAPKNIVSAVRALTAATSLLAPLGLAHAVPDYESQAAVCPVALSSAAANHEETKNAAIRCHAPTISDQGVSATMVTAVSSHSDFHYNGTHYEDPGMAIAFYETQMTNYCMDMSASSAYLTLDPHKAAGVPPYGLGIEISNGAGVCYDIPAAPKVISMASSGSGLYGIVEGDWLTDLGDRYLLQTIVPDTGWWAAPCDDDCYIRNSIVAQSMAVTGVGLVVVGSGFNACKGDRKGFVENFGRWRTELDFESNLVANHCGNFTAVSGQHSNGGYDSKVAVLDENGAVVWDVQVEFAPTAIECIGPTLLVAESGWLRAYNIATGEGLYAVSLPAVSDPQWIIWPQWTGSGGTTAYVLDSNASIVKFDAGMGVVNWAISGFLTGFEKLTAMRVGSDIAFGTYVDSVGNTGWFDVTFDW